MSLSTDEYLYHTSEYHPLSFLIEKELVESKVEKVLCNYPLFKYCEINLNIYLYDKNKSLILK